MEDKKPRVLDVLRLIIAIIVLVGSLYVGISLVLAINNVFNDVEDGFSGLIFLIIFPLFLAVFAYAIIGVKWIKKYNKTKNKPLIERSVNIAEPIVKGVVAGIFLTYWAIPLIIYWVFDLIEAIMRKKLAKKIRGNKSEPDFKTRETNPIADKHYCKYCGKEVDYRYARFCEHCGAEIEFRK